MLAIFFSIGSSNDLLESKINKLPIPSQTLTHKQLEMHGSISNVATDALVLKHQAFGTHNIDYRKVSNIRRTKSQNLNTYRLIL